MTRLGAMEDVDVLIVGAGVSGIGMACALATECPGKTYAILERRQRLGGTWDLFNYPGVRSDSDMLTYGYRFRPWQDAQVLASGPSIREYLVATAREHGVDQHIRYGLRTLKAEWSSAQRQWNVTTITEPGGESRVVRCRQLVMCTGYYNHDAGYTPAFPGIDRFTGRVVHPQHWPQDLDTSNKRVVVVGSGATAMTLVPALSASAAQVTMLQRSPSYVLSVPSRDALTEALSRVLPKRWAFAMARRRNIAISRWLYSAARKWPAKMRNFLLSQTRKQLDGRADMAHFTPSYMPWDQRLCIVPDADLFEAIKSGKASVVTDQITGFDGQTVQLRSGKTLQADILITATGLDVQVLGGMQVSIDGQPYAPENHMLYKGVLMEGVPNFAWIVGYTNLSWTLKSDLAASYLCRLFKHLDAHGLAVARPIDRVGYRMEESVMANLNSGYVVRANAVVPRQGREAPWRVLHQYPSDQVTLLESPIDDGVLTFERNESR